MTWAVNFDATAMFNQFRLKCSVKDKEDEFVLFTRIGRGTKRFTVNNVFWGLLKYDSAFDVGDIVTDPKGFNYFLVAKSNSYRADKAELYKSNCTVKIVRLKDVYEGYEVVDQEEEMICEDTIGVYERVSARMKLFDLGLLKSTTMRVLVPKIEGVKLLDRLYINEKAYQIDDIDTASFPGFLYIQLSEDNRG